MTWRGRYDELGIVCAIDSYRKRIDADSLLVMDVGCSTAVTMNDCKQCLAARGVILNTIGIDQSLKIKEHAETNLDRFILSNVLHVENYDNVADVVICANMLRGVTPSAKSMVIEKCAKFLKPRGILILASSSTYCFGRHLKKSESRLYNPTLRRKLERCLLTIPLHNLVKEIKIFNKTDAVKFSKCLLYK